MGIGRTPYSSTRLRASCFPPTLSSRPGGRAAARGLGAERGRLAEQLEDDLQRLLRAGHRGRSGELPLPLSSLSSLSSLSLSSLSLSPLSLSLSLRACKILRTFISMFGFRRQKHTSHIKHNNNNNSNINNTNNNKTIKQSNNQTIQRSNDQTIKRSNNKTIKQSNNQTRRPSAVQKNSV